MILLFWRLEGPCDPGFVIGDCHSNSNSVPHLLTSPWKRRHSVHRNCTGSSSYPIYHFHHLTESCIGNLTTGIAPLSGGGKSVKLEWAVARRVLTRAPQSGKIAEPSQKPGVQENLSDGVSLGFVFRKSGYFVQLSTL